MKIIWSVWRRIKGCKVKKFSLLFLLVLLSIGYLGYVLEGFSGAIIFGFVFTIIIVSWLLNQRGVEKWKKRYLEEKQ